MKIEKKPFLRPFLEKAIFRKLKNNWKQKKTQTDNWAPKNHPKPLFL